jgi:transketolase
MSAARTPPEERTPAPLEELRRQANLVRRRSRAMVHRAGLGHPGGDFSSAGILAVLYFGVLRIHPLAPRAPERDRFFMSKGHCSGALYAVLAAAGAM